MKEKIICFLVGHKDIGIYRARYFVTDYCLRCSVKIHTDISRRDREINFFRDKYPINWKQYL